MRNKTQGDVFCFFKKMTPLVYLMNVLRLAPLLLDERRFFKILTFGARVRLQWCDVTNFAVY
jgi:hypothetical protein